MYRTHYTRILSDIRCWIFIFFLLRLYGITNPPLEVAHNWRQTTVTMVARNFYEVDSNIAFPRVDFAGEKSGITGMEFPLLNYLIYLVSLVFGYTHWYGRLINLVVSSIGAYYFFLIIRRFFNERLAFYSAVLLLSSLWFIYSRKIMPDTFSTSLVITGFWFGSKYLEGDGNKWLNVLSFIILTLAGILSKIPVAFLMVFFLPFILRKHVTSGRKIVFLLSCLLILIPVVFWYFYWVPYLVKEYGFWHFFMGNSLSTGIKDIFSNAGSTLAHFYDAAFKFIGFGLFAVGLVLSVFRKERKILLVFLLGLIAFLPVIFKGGYTFAHHSYYIIPFIPVMAIAGGYTLTCIPSVKIAITILILVCAENVLNRQHDFRLKEKEEAIIYLEEALNQVSEPDELIVINSDNVPTPMYFAHRKGWLATNDQLANRQYIDSIAALGCRHIVILKRYFGEDMELPYSILMDNRDWKIYRVSPD